MEVLFHLREMFLSKALQSEATVSKVSHQNVLC